MCVFVNPTNPSLIVRHVLLCRWYTNASNTKVTLATKRPNYSSRP